MQDVLVPGGEAWDLAFDGASRDRSRTPMQWDDTVYAGFSRRRPWLPIGPDYRERNVAAQDGSLRSILDFYRQLIALRHETPSLQVGSWEPLIGEPRSALVYLRRSPEARSALVALNFSRDRVRVDLSHPLPTRQWIPRVSTRRPDVGWVVQIDRTIELAPYEATVLTSEIRD
jgi:glycosidase